MASNGEAIYFLTFSCYGLRLHGDDRGSVDRHSNTYGTPTLAPHIGRRHVARQAMAGPAVVLAMGERDLIHAEIQALAERRCWTLHALNVRSTHLHSVVRAEDDPERVMQGMKAWATRALTESGSRQHGERIWARGGSTRYLWDEASVIRTVDYVLFEQQ